MGDVPDAVESFEQEKMACHEGSAVLFDHPVERLKYHITQTGGKILQSESSPDGLSFVVWESEGVKYRAWGTWPGTGYDINWKEI